MLAKHAQNRDWQLMGDARPKILVFDSGLGGLSVHHAIRAARRDADYLYLGDDALFPYGNLAPEVLVERVLKVIGEATASFMPDCIVIACNTASTLVLPALRARYLVPIVGTVPAIKPAAAATRSGLISVLATPGTVAREYTAELVREFADGVDVTLVGAPTLAAIVETHMRGEKIADAAILAEITPAFVKTPRGRTDTIVLACTHYPLLLMRLEALAPWPVTWVDPAPAIARRVAEVIAPPVAGEGSVQSHFTSGAPLPAKAGIDGQACFL